MTSVWFVTPAFRRYDLSAACFRQWTQVRDVLASHGVELQVVVIADDDNLALARAVGFHTIEQDNQWLGRRFNDGIEYAARHGADWIAPMGSDAWVDPDYFIPLPEPGLIRTTKHICMVTPSRLAHLEVAANHGGGPYLIPRSMLPEGFRPAADFIHRGVDRSTVNGLRQPVQWESRDLHPFQLISFRGVPHLTSYDGLVRRWGVGEERDPWPKLAEHYSPDLVDQARLGLGTGAVFQMSVIDTSGQAIRIKQAFDRHAAGVEIRSMHQQTTWQRYETDLPFREHLAQHFYDAADVVHLHNRPEFHDAYDDGQGKPTILHHHGTAFRRNHEVLASQARAINAVQIVSTLDLDVLEPDTTWLPAPYNLSELQEFRDRFYEPGDVIRIAHSPTNRFLKNTAALEAAVESLSKRYPVELLLIQGRPWRACLRRKAMAEIFVDQLSLGTGCNAIEAWGMGIPVIAGVNPSEAVGVSKTYARRIKWRMRQVWGELPFLEASERTLEARLEALIRDPELRTKWGAKGRAHVERFHDESKVVAQLQDIYRSAPASVPGPARRPLPMTARRRRQLLRGAA